MLQIHNQCAVNTLESGNFSNSVIWGPVPGADVSIGSDSSIPGATSGALTYGALKNMISFYARAQGSGNAFPGTPMIFEPLANVGMFFGRYTASGTVLASPANRWRLTAAIGDKGGSPAYLADVLAGTLPQLDAFRREYTIVMPALAQNAGIDIDVPTEAGNFYVTGVWIQKTGSGSWWAPNIGVAPNISAASANLNWPNTAGKVRVRYDLPYTASSSVAANSYIIHVAGYLNPPVPLVYQDILCGAMGNTAIPASDGQYSNVTFQTPPYFRTLGAYMIGRNTGNYYMYPWGFTQRDTGIAPAAVEGRLSVIFGHTVAAGSMRNVAAGDIGVRLVGIQTTMTPRVPAGFVLKDKWDSAYVSGQQNFAYYGVTLSGWSDNANRNFGNPDTTQGFFEFYQNGASFLLRIRASLLGGSSTFYTFNSIRATLTDKARLLQQLTTWSGSTKTKIKIYDFFAWAEGQGTYLPDNIVVTKYGNLASADEADWPQQTTVTGANVANTLEACGWVNGGTNPGFDQNRCRMCMDIYLGAS